MNKYKEKGKENYIRKENELKWMDGLVDGRRKVKFRKWKINSLEN